MIALGTVLAGFLSRFLLMTCHAPFAAGTSGAGTGGPAGAGSIAGTYDQRNSILSSNFIQKDRTGGFHSGGNSPISNLLLIANRSAISL